MNGSRMSFPARSDVCRLRWDRERIFFRNEHKVEYVNGVVFSTHPPTHINRLLARWEGKLFYTIFHNHRDSIFRKSSKNCEWSKHWKERSVHGMSVNEHKFLFPLLLFVLFLFVYRIRKKRSCGKEQWKRFIFTNRYIPSGLERSVGEQLRKLACFRQKNWVLRAPGERKFVGIILLLLYHLL